MNLRKHLACLLTLCVLGGCAAPAPSGGSAAPGADTLTYGSGDYTAINPALYEHGEINALLFSGLTARDAAGAIVPGLAADWTIDAAGTTYTFRLRTDVKWHDGAPFTAADAAFTLNAIRDPANASEIASNYEEIAAVQTPDAHTLTLTLSAPNAALLDYLTVGVLPAHLLTGKDLATDPFNRAPVGTGPYRLTAWDTGQSITLDANADYYGGTPDIERIIFKLVPDAQARAMQLLSGELDFAQIAPQEQERFARDDRFTVLRRTTSDYRGILYNFHHPLFAQHRELPAALSYAIDRDALVTGVLHGCGTAAYSPLQTGHYNNPAIERYPYDPAQTRAALEAAGWRMDADGVYAKDGDRLTFAITCPEGDPVRADLARVCAQQLREAGADVSVEIAQQIDWAGQAAYLIGWGSPYDPDDHTYKVFGSGKGSNFSGYANPAVDRLLTAARETRDDSERLRLYRDFQTALAADPPYTFLVYVDALYVTARPIAGITPETVLGHHGVGIFWNVADWTLEKEETNGTA